MVVEDVIRTFTAVLELGVHPGESFLEVLARQVEKLADEMDAHEVATMLSAYARVEHQPRESVLTALEHRAAGVAQNMTSQELANTLQAYVKLHMYPHVLQASASDATQGDARNESSEPSKTTLDMQLAMDGNTSMVIDLEGDTANLTSKTGEEPTLQMNNTESHAKEKRVTDTRDHNNYHNEEGNQNGESSAKAEVPEASSHAAKVLPTHDWADHKSVHLPVDTVWPGPKPID